MTYTAQEQSLLLNITRRTLEAVTARRDPPPLDLETLPPALREPRACFVTMRRRDDGRLRGCTGTLVARRPLAEEVMIMTVQTAFHDHRFAPVAAREVPGLHLEISVLTPPEPLAYDNHADLLAKLRPGIDGVTLKLDHHRATFLPQVWETYPDPRVFLTLLSEKMGCGPDGWRDPELEVETYQAIVIEEDH